MTKPDSSESVRKLHKVGFYKLSGKLLGKGNFARVEEGIHTLLNTKVAIKVLDTSKIKEKYVAKNLDREARMLAKLEHPSIMCLYETMRVGPIYYLVTELATGGDLCTYIKRHRVGKLDERCARRYGWQIISALAHMHKRGIVHRDLKMENIMLDASREHVKIVDFGLSNTWKAGSMLQTHCGSPEYAAPELFIVGKEYGPEVDLWSLGVVLYGMVTGRLPFLSPRDDTISPHEKRRHLLIQINRGLTPMQMKALGDKSSEFRNLVQRLLTPNTDYRLTLDELLFHPWVTLRQKKSIPDIVPTPPSPIERSCMMEKIAVMTSLSRSVVEKEISINSYGSVGGMYNIMAHMKRLVRSEINGVKWTGSVRRRSCSSNRRPVTSINKQPCELSVTRFSSVMRPKTSPIEHLPPNPGQTRVHGTQLRTVKPNHTRTSAAQPADWSKRLCYITQPTPYMMNGTSRVHNRNPRRNLPQNANETYCPRTPQTAWSQTTRDIKAKLQLERRCITPTEEHCKGSSPDTKRLLNHLLTTTSVNSPSSAGSINKKELMHHMNQMQLLGLSPSMSPTNRMSVWAPQHLPRSTNAPRQQMEQ